jgi:hypothetical protein
MKRIIRLTESDLTRIVRRVIMEQQTIDSSVCDPRLGNRVIGTYYYDGEEDVFTPNDYQGSTYKEEVVNQWKGKLPSDLTYCKK